MESFKALPKKLFSELVISDAKPEHIKSNGPFLTLEGSKNSVQITEQQFRILLCLRKNQGKPVSVTEIEEFLYGDPERDSVLGVGVSVQIHRLNKKLQEIQDPLRFIILSQRYAGYYLVDLERPEMLREGGRETLEALQKGTRRNAGRPKRSS